MTETLQEEWGQAKRDMTRAATLWLVARGVPGFELYDQFGPRIGMAMIAISGAHWLPEADGRKALIVPSQFLDDGAVEDLVAFMPKAPNVFWSRWGNVCFMGEAAAKRAAHDKTHLTVFANPIEWLSARRNGIVILEWGDYLRAALYGIPELRCADLPTARKLRKAFAEPVRPPEITVPRSALKVAG